MILLQTLSDLLSWDHHNRLLCAVGVYLLGDWIFVELRLRTSDFMHSSSLLLALNCIDLRLKTIPINSTRFSEYHYRDLWFYFPWYLLWCGSLMHTFAINLLLLISIISDFLLWLLEMSLNNRPVRLLICHWKKFKLLLFILKIL